MDIKFQKVTKDDLKNAVSKKVPDIIAPNLDILFCGINPGLYTAAVGQHFGRPGNRFWKVLYDSGIAPKLFHPSEQYQLLPLGMGITNFVARASARADELTLEEIHEGAVILEKKVLNYTPRFLAILGIDTYRKGFNNKYATVGKQTHTIGKTQVWALPNPSGLNAHYQSNKLIELFRELKKEVKKSGGY